MPVLADAFLAYLNAAPLMKGTNQDLSAHGKLLLPVSQAICKILYTFCKIRGEKVIVRFFSTETRHLELLLSAIEHGLPDNTQQDGEASSQADLSRASAQIDSNFWEWEERYITLLWLSQLLLAPFDLATISSEESRSMASPQIMHLQWPANIPALTLRVVPLAMRYLSSSGKESVSAKVLLVRVAMRRDMQDIGMFKALVQWALDSLSRISSTTPQPSIFHYTSILSFVGGLLVSSVGTTNMKPYLVRVTDIVEAIFSTEKAASYSYTIRQSPVARKAMVKILRQASVLALQDPEEIQTDEIVQNSVGILLEMLSDTATSVRLAVSKALSVIAAKLVPEQASEVVDAVLVGLEKNAISLSTTANEAKDLSRVDQNEWHGLIMTISHLLYRQTIPADELPRIIEALRRGLTFEQRSANGVSVGINVRDAANFGIWSLARRYTTQNLQGIATQPSELRWDNKDSSETSVLQSLATELVVAASLDPAGNVRRGSSAALQELIGRHPNIVENGIAVVQVVDYHAVALRSRAIQEVGPKAAMLSQHNRVGLLTGLMGWRGIKDGDVSARRNAALAVGEILSKTNYDRVNLADNYGVVKKCLDKLALREVENRHGIVLTLSEVLRRIIRRRHEEQDMTAIVLDTTNNILLLLEKLPTGRLPELFSEASSKFMLACRESEEIMLSTQICSTFTNLIPRFLREDHLSSIDAVSNAATLLLQMPSGERKMVTDVIKKSASQTAAGKGATSIHTLFRLLATSSKLSDDLSSAEILQIISKRWKGRELPDLQIREVILESISASSLAGDEKVPFISLISEGLNDYTTTTRGDIGSKVRIAASKAAGSFITITTPDPISGEPKPFALLVRAAAEKLDKVRAEGQKALLLVLSRYFNLANSIQEERTQTQMLLETLQNTTSSSQEWFYFLLSLQHATWWIQRPMDFPVNKWSLELLSGYVTTAGAGSEDVVRASRAALVDFCLEDVANVDLICITLSRLLGNKIEEADERVLVPTLEVLVFLFDMGIAQTSSIE